MACVKVCEKSNQKLRITHLNKLHEMSMKSFDTVQFNSSIWIITMENTRNPISHCLDSQADTPSSSQAAATDQRAICDDPLIVIWITEKLNHQWND